MGQSKQNFQIGDEVYYLFREKVDGLTKWCISNGTSKINSVFYFEEKDRFIYRTKDYNKKLTENIMFTTLKMAEIECDYLNNWDRYHSKGISRTQLIRMKTNNKEK